VVSGGASFDAQAAQNGVGGVDTFLTAAGGNTANVVNHGGSKLRVSNDNEMAIENSDLRGRQPKVFFATAAVVTAANQALTAAGSRVSLQPGGTGITIWTSRTTQNTLLRVTPLFNNASPDSLPQNCNAIAGEVIGGDHQMTADHGSGYAAETVARLAPQARARYRAAYKDTANRFDDDAHSNALARVYAKSAKAKDIKARGANRHARPGVGETFMIATIGAGPQLANGVARVRDYKSGEDRDLGWSFHFGGVVARSGGDRITLENYARGDNRQATADPRWYFQMYGEKKGQSFHEFHAGRKEYANPVTVAVDKNTDFTSIHKIDG
jgi:hypothetical protein